MTIYQEVAEELERARAKFPPFHSAHEGIAVIREEFEELWDDTKLNASIKDMRAEAIQVASSAIRFIEDVCGG